MIFNFYFKSPYCQQGLDCNITSHAPPATVPGLILNCPISHGFSFILCCRYYLRKTGLDYQLLVT